MKASFRKGLISVFVLSWIFIFHYESTRAAYLEPLLKQSLPKIKFLFPPAGWIMFYRVEDSAGFAEVYGVRGPQIQRIDPHDVLETRPIGYDNIHRNVLSTVLNRPLSRSFCSYLKRKFPDFDDFLVTQTYYPSLTRDRYRRMEAAAYRCSASAYAKERNCQDSGGCVGRSPLRSKTFAPAKRGTAPEPKAKAGEMAPSDSAILSKAGRVAP